ncbi:RDD family protein [Streptomyces sp. NPDC003691]
MGTPTDEGGNVPGQGYYPDPSIPGYVRYWNGAAWVPGTSRPAPKDGDAAPVVPAPAAAAPAPVPASAPEPVVPVVEETGPVFLDEEPEAEPARAAEPASAWQADTSRQSGFGAERDRVDWGGTGAAAARVPAQAPAPGEDPTGGALSGVRTPESAEASAPVRPVPESTVTIRPVRPQEPQLPQTPQAPQHQVAPALQPQVPQPQAPQPHAAQAPAPVQPLPAAPQLPAQPHPHPQAHAHPQAPAPAPVRPLVPEQAQAQAQPVRPAPVTDGPGGGAASWAQQPPGAAAAEPPVVPWKPPVDDPFLSMARAQAAARPAGLGRRLVARLIDTAVLGGLVGAVAVPLVTGAIDHVNGKIEAAERSGETVTVWLLDGTTGVQSGILLAALLVLGVLYEALPTAKWGRTLGKKVCGISVVDIESHEPPSFGAALRRWLVYSGLGLIAVGVVNVVWCLFDRPWRQCWHDKAARTFVQG